MWPSVWPSHHPSYSCSRLLDGWRSRAGSFAFLSSSPGISVASPVAAAGMASPIPLGALAAALLRVAAWVWRPGDLIYNWFEVRGLTMILALERSRQGVTNYQEPRTLLPASKDHAGQAAAESPETGAGRADGG